MHDCNKFKEKMVDLLFESVDGDERFGDERSGYQRSGDARSGLLAEILTCNSCDSLYRSMSETLTVFDQVTRTAEPEESYWIGYENRLQARLTEHARLTEQAKPTEHAQLADARPRQNFFAPLFVKDLLARLPIALKVAFACLVLAVGLWLLFNRIERTNPPALTATDSADPSPDQKMREDNNKPQDQKRDPVPKQTIAKKPRHTFTTIARHVKPETKIDGADSGGRSERHSGSNAYLKTETASHLEKAELLMRSFRNVKLSEDPAAFDVSYERQFSKQLLANNRRLRRSAEHKRALSIEDLLTGIEPLLLDIANLPDNPAEDDVRSIKELIQKQEVVATLQLYSAKASSRNYR